MTGRETRHGKASVPGSKPKHFGSGEDRAEIAHNQASSLRCNSPQTNGLEAFVFLLTGREATGNIGQAPGHALCVCV